MGVYVSIEYYIYNIVHIYLYLPPIPPNPTYEVSVEWEVACGNGEGDGRICLTTGTVKYIYITLPTDPHTTLTLRPWSQLTLL